MALIEQQFNRFIGGIADFDKESMIPDSVYWERCIDFRSNPREAKIMPCTLKKTGNIVLGLPKWGDIVGSTVYVLDDAGNMYTRVAGNYTKVNQSGNSHGNGLAYYPDDDSIYYANDYSIGRYGKLSGTPTFIDDYFTTIGGVPQNTYSLSSVAASSQYAYRADSASLSITGDLTIETNVKPTTFPAVGSGMTFASKWNESGNLRSYRFGVKTVGGYFGDGSDGALTISADTTDAPIDSACTGTTGTTSLTATNASFATNQVVLIHQTQGTGAGIWQKNKIVGYTAGSISLDTALNSTYSTGAQVIVLKQYSSVTVNSGKTWTAKAWNGTTGGILAFLCSGTLTVTGTISASGKGYRGGAPGTRGGTPTNSTQSGYSGESYGTTQNYYGGGYGADPGGTVSPDSAAPYNGGGGGRASRGEDGASGGGGGGNGATGSNGASKGNNAPFYNGGYAGATAGSNDLTTITFGGGGGGPGGIHDAYPAEAAAHYGGIGGGIIFAAATNQTITGAIISAGVAGVAYGDARGGSGGGAGGSILIKAQTATLGTTLITASGGAGGAGQANTQYSAGGAGGTGRIHIDYYTSYTGTTTPTINATQDSSLANSTVQQLFLDVSANGTAYDSLTKQSDNLKTGAWQHAAVTWDASAALATFYIDGASIGTSTGTLTAISDNTSQFFIDCDKNGAGTAVNFFDGLQDDTRVWNTIRTASDLLSYKDVQLIGNETGLKAYYKFNNALTDLTANTNDLTNSSTTYSTDVPFTAPNGRMDVDQSQTLTGQTYTLATSITESGANTVTFTPTTDPQKSIAVKLAAKGTGDWTLVVHDSSHQLLATKTIATADLPAANQMVEFIFPTVWRPQLSGGGAQYHFHLTSTVADGTVTTGTTSDLSTVTYATYFQYLVNRTDYHPIMRFQNFLMIGNDRYVGKWDLIAYEPNRLILPGEYTVRCMTLWNEYAAIGCVRGSNVTSVENGRIFFWDGVSDLYNFFIDVPEGAINAMLGNKGIIDFYAGARGKHMRYSGGSTATKVRELPKMDKGTTVEIMPGALTMYNAILHTGTGPSTSSTVEQGVYSYGSLNPSYPESLGYDHVISTGTRTNVVKIGLVMAYDGKLIIGWQDNVSYGIDEVDQTNSPYTTATIEFLTQDAGRVYKDKTLQRVKIQYLPLISGQSMSVKYKLDRNSWISSTDSTVGSFSTRVEVGGGRFSEYQMAIDFATTVTTSPTLLVEVSQYEDNKEENMI